MTRSWQQSGWLHLAQRRVLRTAVIFIVALIAVLSVFPARAQSYAVTSLSLGGSYGGGLFNAVGQFAGYSYLSGNASLHAIFFDGTTLTDLGTLGGTYSSATAVNSSGQVVGWSYTAGNTAQRAFSWTQSGGMVDLGTLGGDHSNATAVTGSGQVVGQAYTAGNAYHAFVWTQSGGMVDLGTLGGTYSSATAVNSSDQVIGQSYTAGNNSYHAFVWTQSGGMVDLGTLGGTYSYAAAVNSSGQVVGQTYLAGNAAQRAFSWTQSGGMVDLGTLGGTSSSATAVTGSGQVIGQSYTAGNNSYHAFSWTQSGGMVDLGTLGGSSSYAQVVNSSGQVIGQTYLAGNTTQRAFSWTQSGGMVDLGTLPLGAGTQSAAWLINSSGQVAGSSYNHSTGEQRAFVWTASGGMVDLNDVTPGKPAGMVVLYPVDIADDGSIVAGSNVGLVLLRPGPSSTNAPLIGPIAANDPAAVNSSVNVSASFTDADISDTHTATWTWGDGGAPEVGTIIESSGSGTVSGTHSYGSSGIYSVSLTVTDSTGRSMVVSRSVVVYDPSAGFVTGGGWIASPAGAYKADTLLAGRANFGFVSKYQKGAKVPTGETEFQFQAASLNFHSTSYDWLVVAGARAQYKGTGTINGSGSYKFMLTAIDGQVVGGGGTDRFRIKIWHYDADLEQDVVDYDNQIDTSGEGTPTEGTAIGGGSIVIHTPKK